jgi:hypothetical protein
MFLTCGLVKIGEIASFSPLSPSMLWSLRSRLRRSSSSSSCGAAIMQQTLESTNAVRVTNSIDAITPKSPIIPLCLANPPLLSESSPRSKMHRTSSRNSYNPDSLEEWEQVHRIESLLRLEAATSSPHQFTFEMEMDDENRNRDINSDNDGLKDLDFGFPF